MYGFVFWVQAYLASAIVFQNFAHPRVVVVPVLAVANTFLPLFIKSYELFKSRLTLFMTLLSKLVFTKALPDWKLVHQQFRKESSVREEDGFREIQTENLIVWIFFEYPKPFHLSNIYMYFYIFIYVYLYECIVCRG